MKIKEMEIKKERKMRVLIITSYESITREINEFFNYTNNHKVEILKRKFVEYITVIIRHIDCVGIFYLFLIEKNEIKWISPDYINQRCSYRESFFLLK